MPRPPVEYGHARSAQSDFWHEVHRLLRGGARRWCDIGRGSNPVLPVRQLEKGWLDYAILDRSQAELDEAPSSYHRLRGGIVEPQTASELLAHGGSSAAMLFGMYRGRTKKFALVVLKRPP